MTNRISQTPKSLRILAIDLDNVISETDETIRNIIYSLCGIRLWCEDIVTFNYHEVLHAKGMSMSEALIVDSKAMDLFHTSECLGVPVKPGARAALRELLSLGANVGIVTGRPINSEAITAKWLSEREIPYTWLKHTNDKAAISSAWSMLVDDAAHHAVTVAANGVPVCLMDYPWNRNLQPTAGITRVSSWNEILKYCRSL